ncbi:MAG: ABC transporter substrate-binding protein [Methanocellales archaeon]|nr:ABC transporter substrate-binding protein [Methanocellales archaeon]MDD3290975.1 ABC transporter substrate-binding protein [Methanocellales archaeon]MDD5234860.1 ABC transporter substrate-binding protein [Methanocellales archaeon]MDD5484770.1 ABC transporter substrate-binding protein [Methanocellales archaeon]
MRRMLSLVLVILLLSSAMPLAVTPAAAYEMKIPCDDGDNILTKEELVNAILPYMLDEGEHSLDEIGDAAWVYAYWGGEPKKIVDTAGREVTFCRPVERVITREPDTARSVIAVGAGDKLVASEQATKSCLCPTTFETFGEGCLDCYYTILDGRMPDLPETSTRYDIYYELMASLRPDVIFTSSITNAADFETKVGVPCVVAEGSGWVFDYKDGVYGQIEVVGKALDKEDDAQELIDFIESKVNMVRSVTETLNESEKPTVYFAPRGAGKGFYDPKEGRDFTRTEPKYPPLDIAGGINVAKDEPGATINVGIEQIITWNPEYIFISCSDPDAVDDIDNIRNAAFLQSISAIQNDTVYNCFYPHCRGQPPDRNLFNMMYMAKLLHPDEFKDLDLEKEGNEIFEAFLGVDGVFTDYADYLIWPREYLDTQ